MKLPSSLTTVTPISKILALILFLTLPILGFLFGVRYQQIAPSISPAASITEINQVFPTPTMETKPTIMVFKKTLFDPQGNLSFMPEMPYPSIMKNLKMVNLVGLNCTQRYVEDAWGAGTTFISRETNYPRLQDRDMLTFLQQRNESGVSAITKCTTEDGKIVIEYELSKKGEARIGFLNSDFKLDNETKIRDISGFFTCDKPLALTTNNIFYYECINGDGDSGDDVIYSVDLNTRTSTEIYNCHSRRGKVSCK